ncbi:MAG: hypothetical protein ACTHOP_22165 [Mesorhizobium sp.]
MGRYSKSSAYGHRVHDMGWGLFRISWIVDRYYPNSRLRHPVTYSRDTDRNGAIRFADKWNVPERFRAALADGGHDEQR